MAWTKRQLAADAFAELALAGYTFDITPDEQATAIGLMDRMVGGWGAKVSLEYAFPATPGQSDPDDDSGLTDAQADAVVQNLAVRLCGHYGKQPPLTLLQSAKTGLNDLMAAASTPTTQLLPGGVPLGAGHKSRGYAYPQFTTDPE